MPEPRELTEEGLDHLQRAGRELLHAARSFLDAVEGVVEDRDRLAGLAEGVGGAVNEVLGVLRPLGERLTDPDRPRPWEAAATRPGDAGSWEPPRPADPAGTAAPAGPEEAVAPVGPTDVPEATAPPEATDPPEATAPTAPAGSAGPREPADPPGPADPAGTARPRARVRRIPVD